MGKWITCPLAFEPFLLLSIPWIFIGVVLFDHGLGAVWTSRLMQSREG